MRRLESYGYPTLKQLSRAQERFLGPVPSRGPVVPAPRVVSRSSLSEQPSFPEGV